MNQTKVEESRAKDRLCLSEVLGGTANSIQLVRERSRGRHVFRSEVPSSLRETGNRFKRAIETFAKHIAGGDSLLFMVVAKHTAEDCPGGLVRPDKDFLAKVVESVERSGVTLTEIYLDAPGHVYFLIVDANDNEALNIALEQFRLVGKVKTHPVLKLSDATAWAKKIGIQR